LVRTVRNPTGELLWNPASEPPMASTTPIEGIRAAVHLSGANVGAQRWTSAYKREMTESRVNSTRALARMLAGLRQPPATLIVASAVGIYGDRGGELLNESSAAGSGFLAELCQHWEQAAEPARQAGIRVVQMRLGVILGPGGALAKMLPLFRLGLGGPLGSGCQWMSWVSLEDAVRAILFAAQRPELQGPVNLTAPEPVTNAAFTCALAHALARPAVLRTPAFALRLALGQMASETLLSSTRVFPSKLVNASFSFHHTTVDAALAVALGNATAGNRALS